MDNFKTRVTEAQVRIKAPKNQRNSFGNYNYRSCEDILEAAKPICAELHLLLTVTDTVKLIGDRYYIEATARLDDTESDEFKAVTASARESESKKGMDDSQVSGTASSYARKYALNGLFCIDDTKDADTDEYKRSTAKDERAEDYAPVTPPPAEPTKFVCNHCGKVLAPYKDRNGKDISIRQHAAGSEKKFGQVLCLDCIQQFYPDSVRKDNADATE